MDWFAFQTGATAFVIAFAAAVVFFAAFKFLYQLITPYNERVLIRQGNVAAAVALGGALIGYVLPLASALTQTVSLPEFAAWALLAGVIQIVSFMVVSRFLYRALAARIEAGEVAAGVYLASISLGVGLLNAACMTA
jgi:putative membrane protein